MIEFNNPAIVQTWSHTTGIVRLVFSPDGNTLYTSGSEGYMRVFDLDPKADPPADPALIEHHEEAITCISASNEYICSASESGSVSLHDSKTNEFSTLLLRNSMPVRSARFDPKGRKVAIASDELIVKVINVKDTLQVQLLTGHKKGVRETTWSPDGTLLTTSSQDGEIRVWELSGTEATCVKILEGLIPVDAPESFFSVEVVWHPSGKYFVVASKTNEIVVISRETWSRTSTFSSPGGHTAQISALTWSANGAYLASAAADGQLIIWATATRSIVNRTELENKSSIITSMRFQPVPGTNLITFVTSEGKFFRWTGPIPSNLQGPSEGIKSSRSEVRGGSIEASNNGRGSSVPAVRENGNGGSKRKEVQMEDDTSDFGEDDWIDDDLGNAMNERTYGGEREAPARLQPWNMGDSYSSSSKGQDAFQPGATPFTKKRRYLAFNMLGLIHVVERDDQNLITIEFHDRGSRTGSHFNDTFRYSLAALGESGAVFASKSTGDETLSYIHYRPYDSWTTVQEWTFALPLKENATLVAVGGMSEPVDLDDDEEERGNSGSGTVVVATDKGYLRFFSGSGLQKYLWHFGEEIVSMSAGKDWVFLLHRSVDSRSGGSLDYSLIDTDTFEIVQNGRMPLSKGTSIEWIGLTDEQIPAMYDSNGVLSILDRSRRPKQARWVPVLDTNNLARREGKQESYWPVGLTDQHAHVIILKGEEHYPQFPTPLFQELELQVPTLRLEVAQGKLEEEYLRSNLFLSHLRDGLHPNDYQLQSLLTSQSLSLDKNLLKIIQTSCKSDKLQAALDCTILLSQVASMDAAVKIAGFFNLRALKLRMEKVREARIKKDEEDGEDGIGKRESKWEHKVDDRTILAPNTTKNRNSSGFYDDIQHTPARSSTGRSTFSRTPASSAFKNGNMNSTPRLSSDGAIGEEMQVDEEEDYGNEQEDVEEQADEEFIAPPPKPSANPFKKSGSVFSKSDPSTSSPAPFASKNAQSKASVIQRTESFNERVEHPSSKTSNTKARPSTTGTTTSTTTTAAIRQTTLFGIAAGIPKPKENKAGRKRKADTEGEEVVDEGKSKGKGKEISISSMFKLASSTKELPREGEEFEESQVEAETQEESQNNKKQKSDTLEEVEMENGETQETQETQSEETQVEESEESIPEVVAPVTTKSKLESFRMIATEE